MILWTWSVKKETGRGQKKNIKAFNLVNPDWAIREIDIIIDTPIDYGKAVRRAKNIKLSGINIPTISIADLISMKRKANRLQDKADIKNLSKLLR